LAVEQLETPDFLFYPQADKETLDYNRLNVKLQSIILSMERLVKVGELIIKTNIPSEECASCSAIPGEMSIFASLAESQSPIIGEVQAQVQCHQVSGKTNSRHIDITLDVGGEESSARNVVRNWANRRVHCQIK